METIVEKLTRLAKITKETHSEVSQELFSIIKQMACNNEIFSLLESKSWPTAVDPALICESTEEDKMIRAGTILETLITKKIKNLNFLDLGCGEGYTTLRAKEFGAVKSVGFDIKKQGDLIWEKEENGLLLTTKYENLVKRMPFDIILIYDVIDHIENDEIVSFLAKAKTLMNQKGTIYLRCHPFCGRHGGHIYKELNKAFAHLILTDAELAVLGVKNDHQQEKIFKPMRVYEKCIHDAILKIRKRNIIESPVEEFFKNEPQLYSRILERFDAQDFPEFQMKQEFIDYELD